MSKRNFLETMLAALAAPGRYRRGTRSYADNLLAELFDKPLRPSNPGDASAAKGVALSQVIPLLRAAREEQGVSLAELHDETGISRGRLSRIENQIELNPTIGTLDRIAAALGLRLLVTLDEIPAPMEPANAEATCAAAEQAAAAGSESVANTG